MSDTSVTDTEQLVRELYRLGRVRRELARHAMAELGSQGFNALAALEVDGPQRVSDVADCLVVDLSVASRQINALALAGYVRRDRDPDDGRAYIVSITDAGHRVLTESHRRMVEAFDEAVGHWPRRDVRALSRALARLRGDFDRAAQPAGERAA